MLPFNQSKKKADVNIETRIFLPENRYYEEVYLVLDENKLTLNNHADVLIYRNELQNNDIEVCLGKQADDFKQLKPYIIFITSNLCKMDGIAQKFDASCGHHNFVYHYEVAYIHLEPPNTIKVCYWGTHENTEFDVVFQHHGNDIILKSFGTLHDISPNWEKK